MSILQHGEHPCARALDPPSVVRPIRAGVSYLCAAAEVPINYLYEPPTGTPRENCRYEQRVIDIHDCRPTVDRLSVDRQGFELREAPTRVADFFDDAQVTRSYYPEIAELARLVAGSTRAYVFDHLVRKREPSRPLMSFGERSRGARPDAAGRVHNDYTELSGRRRLSMVLNDAHAEAAVTRFGILTLWRSITPYPVLDTPLAVCDAGSVAAGDLVAGEIRYRDRTGEIYLVTHSPDHRWWYVPDMERNDVLVFKQYDSATGVARFTPHAAFDHPDAPAGALPRQSIEVRCLVTYD
jgi:hypothetical protein